MEAEHAVERRGASVRVAVALALLAPAAWLVQRLLAERPELVERVYSRGLFPPLVRALAAVSGRVPFSLGEVGLAALVLWACVGLVRGWRARRRGAGRWALVLAGSARVAGLAGVLYFVYVAVWGLNHQRVPFARSAGYDVAPPQAEELAAVAEYLVETLSRTRPGLPEDEDGVSRMPYGRADLQRRARAAYDAAAEVDAGLAGPPGVLKRPWLSPVLSAWWISGIWSPFTAEAHVNAEMPDPQVAFAACHELAHSLGYARENEANFLAWLATDLSGDDVLAYSGALRAAGSVLAALARADPARAAELARTVGEGVVRDEAAVRAFWESTRSVSTEVAQAVNDTYLKSQGQTAGVRSYGMFVDLMVAEWRRRGE